MSKPWGGALQGSLHDNAKKVRGKSGSPFRLVKEILAQEPLRKGVKGLWDTISRKRQPMGPRLLPLIVLTGFVTVMVSYSSLQPAALKHVDHDLVSGKQDAVGQDGVQAYDPQQQEKAQSFAKRVGGLWGDTRVEGSRLVSESGIKGLVQGQLGRFIHGSKVSLPAGALTGNPPTLVNPAQHPLLSTAEQLLSPDEHHPGSGSASLDIISNAIQWTARAATLGVQRLASNGSTEDIRSTIPPWIASQPESQRPLWLPPTAENLHICIDRTVKYKAPVPHATNGYLIVTANGGLNQMRAAICDMVAVARIMNVTLVVPQLDHSSFWADSSNFEDIFQLDHFIEELRKDIRVIRELPESVKSFKPIEVFPVSWSPFKYYRKDLLKKLKKHRVMVFPLTDSRLANNKLPESIQRLRCRANYRALKYTPIIETVADNLVKQLHARGPYIALHLRYEKDMLAFTGCNHGLSQMESEELKAMRLNNSRWKEKSIDGRARRKEGLCPLTPGETALYLRALGFPNTSVIYIAAGDIYGSLGLLDLKALYPNTFTHNSLLSAKDLASLGRFQNRMAAVDYTVAVESDVFVYTYEGNMARAVQGHRRFEGHRKTIMPDRKLVVRYIDLFEQGVISWSEFRRAILGAHEDRMGGPHLRLTGDNPKNEENFFANPYPGCICEGSSSSTPQ